MLPVYAGRRDDEPLDMPENEAAKEAFTKLLRALAALNPADYAEPIRYSPEAIAIRTEMERGVDALSRLPTTPIGLTAHLGKWQGKISRMALLFHAVESIGGGDSKIAPEISAATMERVQRFMIGFLLPHARRFYHDLRIADEHDDVRGFANYILTRPKPLERVTLAKLRRGKNLRRGDDKRIIDAMDVLRLCGLVSRRAGARRSDSLEGQHSHLRAVCRPRREAAGGEPEEARGNRGSQTPDEGGRYRKLEGGMKRYKTIAHTPVTGMGYRTRQSVEPVLLATRGQPKRLAKDVRQAIPDLLLEPRREHSRKPGQFFAVARQLCEGPYLELFSREKHDGWDVAFSNEEGKFDAAAD
jgi:hypothetical protein